MKKPLLAATVILTLFCAGCGLTVKENRPLLTNLDSAVQDSWVTSSPYNVIAAPVAAPVALGAGAIDASTTLAYRAARQAGCLTYETLWAKPEGSDFRQAVLVFPKALLTPLWFAGQFTYDYLTDTTFAKCKEESR